jgi:hypothetical protein
VIEDMVRSLSVTSFDGKSLPLEETFAGRRSSTFGVPTLEGRVVDHCKHHQPEDIFNVFYPLSIIQNFTAKTVLNAQRGKARRKNNF